MRRYLRGIKSFIYNAGIKTFLCFIKYNTGKKCKKHEHFVETNLSIFFFGKFFGKNGEDIN